jgi:hypothetical protein
MLMFKVKAGTSSFAPNTKLLRKKRAKDHTKTEGIKSQEKAASIIKKARITK